MEYLQSSGAQYIVTSVLNTTPLDYWVKVEIVSYNSSNYLFGTWGSNGRFFVAYTSSTLSLGYANNYSAQGKLNTGIIYELSGVMKPGEQTLYVDGTLRISMSTTTNISPAAYIPIFSSGTSNYVTARIYGIKFENNNTAILDYIPCYRKADSKPGMYDLVTNTFYTNAGTGADFTVGNNV